MFGFALDPATQAVVLLVGGTILGFGLHAGASWLHKKNALELAAAEAALERARATPDPSDDVLAEAALQRARESSAFREAIAEGLLRIDPSSVLRPGK